MHHLRQLGARCCPRRWHQGHNRRAPCQNHAKTPLMRWLFLMESECPCTEVKVNISRRCIVRGNWGVAAVLDDVTEGNDRRQREARGWSVEGFVRVLPRGERPPFSQFCPRSTSPYTEVNGHLHWYDQYGLGEHLQSTIGWEVANLEGATVSLASAVLLSSLSEISAMRFPTSSFFGL